MRKVVEYPRRKETNDGRTHGVNRLYTGLFLVLCAMIVRILLRNTPGLIENVLETFAFAVQQGELPASQAVFTLCREVLIEGG